MVPALHCPCHVQSKIGKQCYGKGSKKKKVWKISTAPTIPGQCGKIQLNFFLVGGVTNFGIFFAFLDKLDPFTF